MTSPLRASPCCSAWTLLAVIAARVSAATVPPGWREFTAAEREEDWRREDAGRFVSFDADLDQDGSSDRVRLLVRRDDGRVGLFVTLGEGDGGRTFLITESRAGVANVMGVAVAEPGAYERRCEDDDADCEDLELTRPGIRYFKQESAAMLFFWEPRRGTFRAAWLSD